MKNLLAPLLLSLVLLVGCISSESKATINNQAARSDNIVNKINTDRTSRSEEQAYIRAMRVVWWSLNHDVNDFDLPADIVEVLMRLGLLEEDQ